MRLKKHTAEWVKFAFVAMATVTASAQPTPGGPRFEVALIKEIREWTVEFPTGRSIGFTGGPGSRGPERVQYFPATLRMLLAYAYGLRGEQQLLGPSSLDKKWYSVTAVLPPKSTREQLAVMMQAFLTERFAIRSHVEYKKIPIYEMIVLDGTKLKQAEVSSHSDPGSRSPLDAQSLTNAAAALSRKAVPGVSLRRWPRATMAELADELSSKLDRPVVDRTGLTARYAVDLTWSSLSDRGPSLSVAVEEQLGLQLRNKVEKLQVLSIDQVRASPTEN